jgi:transcriptional regulator
MFRLLLNPDEGSHGTLYGHLAKCQSAVAGAGRTAAEAMVIFAGEQAYISPAFYPSKAEHGKAVPTWNYLAVHAYGHGRPCSPMRALLRVVSSIK